MRLCFLISVFLPYFVIGQPNSIESLDPQCLAEFQRMIGCVKNETVYSKIGDLKFPSKPFDKALSEEITNVLNCSNPQTTCNAFKIFREYHIDQRNVIDNANQNLETCLTKENIEQIWNNCQDYPRPGMFGLKTEKCRPPLCKYKELIAGLPNCGPKKAQQIEYLVFFSMSSCFSLYGKWNLIEPYIIATRRLSTRTLPNFFE